MVCDAMRCDAMRCVRRDVVFASSQQLSQDVVRCHVMQYDAMQCVRRDVVFDEVTRGETK